MQINHAFIYVPNPQNDNVVSATTYIVYKNFLETAVVLQGGDVSKLYDNLTNIFYTLSAGSYTLEFEFSQDTVLNCFAVAGCNFKSASISMLFKVYENNNYVDVSYLSDLQDNQPAMICFDDKIARKIKIEITCAGTANIGELAVSKALKMPLSPSVGYRPARWNNDDEITSLKTHNMHVGRSTIIKKAAKEILPFGMIHHDFMRSSWASFILEAKGVPIWVGWNQLDYPSECMYGSWEQDDSQYKSSLFSSINLTIYGNF